MNTKERINDLIERYLEIVHSPRNQENKKLWRKTDDWNRDMWRGFPQLERGAGPVPFTVSPDNSLWGKIMGVDLTKYYTDPYVYLETQLRYQLYHFENYPDNVVFTDELFIWFGVITELSFFGADIVLYSHKEPWIQGTVISDYEEVKNKDYPDFYKSGLMPRIHQYYEVFQEMARGRLKVMFPDFVRGPFCISTHLKGHNDILLDSLADPEGVSMLMRYIVESNKHWRAEREKFTGEKNTSCKLYNDEIDCPSISPRIYEELILPFETELAEHYGGISYWHSCGNTTLLLPLLKRLPNLELLHIGPWTDYALATKLFAGTDTALDICVHPQSDVLEADEARMLQKIKDIHEKCAAAAYSVRADAIMPSTGMDEDAKIRQWAQLAAKVLG